MKSHRHDIALNAHKFLIKVLRMSVTVKVPAPRQPLSRDVWPHDSTIEATCLNLNSSK